MKTKDLNRENISKLTRLFPELLTEVEKDGEIIKTINVEKLKELVGDFADESDEIYELSWVGKQKSRQKIVKPVNKTLRPVPEESVDFENTENLYIEGDNFEVLKLLQESYLNKIKMIYIDPPYNTGNDFIYKDKFAISREVYDEETGAIDEEGNKLFLNTTTNGRFHSDWISMIYERLVITKDLLKDDGVIFISVDDNEVDNLKKICDEIFSENNFVGSFIWHKKLTGGYDNNWLNTQHEYVLIYTKNKELFKIGKEKKESKYSLVDENGRKFKWDSLWSSSLTYSPSLDYQIEAPDGTMVDPIGQKGKAFWLWGKEKVKNNGHLLKFQKDKEGNWKVYKRVYASEDGIIPSSILDKHIVKGNTHSAREMKEIFGERIFDYSKPATFIKYLVERGNLYNNEYVLDFFSGSATTGHAVMQLNAEDGINRKFILVQLLEETDRESEAYAAGYKTISEIGKERIKRAGKKIKKELDESNKQKKLGEEGIDPSNLDFGFRVFKLDSSNMKDVYYNPSEIDQRTLINFKDNIKEDRTDKDLLYQVLLELAIPISAKIKEEQVSNKTIYRVNDNFLIACFDDEIDLETIKKIAELNPLRIVFKDSSFKDDAAKVNCDEYLKNKLPNTIVKVI